MRQLDTKRLSEWLLDHTGADSLSLMKSGNDTVTVVMRFGEAYCGTEYSVSEFLYQPKSFLVDHVSRVRDEFFMLGMHVVSEEEGKTFIDSIP